MAENKLAEVANRVNRELDTRAKDERPRSWTPPTLLPDPAPEPGYKYRWIRVSMMGQSDPRNVSTKLREGWEPVKASDHPEIELAVIENERFKDNIIIGGLMLCKAPEELVEDRTDYYQQQAEGQMRSVDNNLMRESDPRMPIFNDRRSKVTFGKG